MVSEKYDRRDQNPYDLEPEEEHPTELCLKKNMMRILCLLHIIQAKNVHFMQWMIHRIPHLH